MEKFSVIHTIKMVSGNLAGIIIPNRRIDYVAAHLETVKKEFEEDVSTKKVYTDCSRNKYIITSFEIVH